jgi:hypothetical protein
METAKLTTGTERHAKWIRRSRTIIPESAKEPYNGKMEPQRHKFDEESGFKLVFTASASQPNYERLFLASGGPINTAAAAGNADFSVSGSGAAVSMKLSRHSCNSVEIDLPKSILSGVGDGQIKLNSHTKLNFSTQRVGCAINGTLVDTHAGAGSVYLANLLRIESHLQAPAVYGTLASHACTFGISNPRVVDASGEPVDVEFVENEELLKALAGAEKVVEQWAGSAWKRRTAIVYDLSPALTKSVAKVPVGVNDKGYDLVHNVIDREFPFSIQALNGLFENAVGIELEYNEDDIKQMLEATANPGMRAAVWAQTVAAACSTAVCYLVAYRADGRTVMRATGSGFEATESWLRTAMRTPCEANDCDGSALLVMAMLQSAVDASPEDLEEYPYVRAIKNVVYPYYTHTIAVVGATSAEASSGGGSTDHVAGHALVLMIPTINFMAAMDKGASEYTVAGEKVAPDSEALKEARYNAVFTEEVLSSLPDEEAQILRSKNLGAWQQAWQLQPYAVEGTTPASPVLYMEPSDLKTEQLQSSQNDKKAFAALAPNVGRSLKILHVAGKGGVHGFYHELVDVSVHPSHPFFSNPAVRALGQGASQFTLAHTDSVSVQKAGCSPENLVKNNYILVPLVSVDTADGALLDVAADVTRADVIPPRAGAMVLTDYQSEGLNNSIMLLEKLDAKLSKQETPGHCVAYIFAYSTLVNNPLAIEHFCQQAEKQAVAGAIDFRVVEGLAKHPTGEEAGNFVVVNVVVPV